MPIRLIDLLFEGYEYIGVCDRVRKKCDANEKYWHVMMKYKKPISDQEFLKKAEMRDLLDDDEDSQTWIADQKRQDSEAGAYKSKWGGKNCVFYQSSGFEFIFVENN